MTHHTTLTKHELHAIADAIPKLYADHKGNLTKIATDLGLNRIRLASLIGNNPLVGDAYNAAHLAMLDQLEQQGIEAALDPGKYRGCNTQPMIFALKAKAGWSDRMTVHNTNDGFGAGAATTADKDDDQPETPTLSIVRGGTP